MNRLSASPPAWGLAVALGLAGTLPAQAITNATPTTAFQAVGFFGVQVAPDWVLTVNHVAAAFFPVNASTIDFSNGWGTRSVVGRYDAPGSGVFPAHDLSLLRLAPGSGGAFYLPISSDLFNDGTFPALDVTLTSAANSSLARAYAHSTVSEFATQIDPDDGGPLGPVTANYLLSLDALRYVESGDSGGGLFLGHVTDASSPLLGLSSAQLGDTGQPPTGSAFVHLAAYRSWIDATLATAPGNTQLLQWVSSVPETSSLLMWALGLAALAGTVSARRCNAR
jgi:Trypsin